MSVSVKVGNVVVYFFPMVFCSCDEPRSSSNSAATKDSGPRITRVDRSRQDQVPTQRKQLTDAFSKAMSIQSVEARDIALAELAWSALENNPDLSAKAVLALSIDSSERRSLIQVYVTQLAQQNPEAALAWAASLSSPGEIKEAREGIIQLFADNDPRRAASLLPKPGMDDREVDDTTLYVLHRLTADKPMDAASWVVTFPPGKARKTAIGTVATDWVQTDSNAAFTWLASLIDPHVRSEAEEAIMNTFIDQPQEIRIQWLEQADPKICSKLERLAEQLAEEMEESILPESE